MANSEGVWLTLRVEAFSLMTVPVFLKAVDVFSPRAFTLSFSLERGGERERESRADNYGNRREYNRTLCRLREVIVIGVASLDAGASSRDGTRCLLGAIRERGDSLLVGSGLLHS